MHQLITPATAEIARFLYEHLPDLSDDWWRKHVVERLSFQQQRAVQERNLSSLEKLDFAALLRILDQNWFEIASKLNLPREGRTWIRELQAVRNRWAHLPAESVSAGDLYRDLDTLNRVLVLLRAAPALLQSVESSKSEAVYQLANGARPGVEDYTPESSTHVSTSGQIATRNGAKESSECQFSAGELVALRSHPDILLPILEVLTGGAETRYIVFQDSRKVTYYESQLQRPPESSREHVELSLESLHAYLTSLFLQSSSSANLLSLRSGRVKFVPYQYRPVLKLIRADRPRLLVADEVGVGKTIEAGLIIKELRARMDITSVLIICPKALVAERKWFVEMKRFDEHFTALDGALLRHCLHETQLDGEWPEQYSKAIIPFSLFDSELLLGADGKGSKKKDGLLKLDPPPRFDLVIVDEAHHIRNSDTYLHQAVRYFCDNSEAAVFLTATPVQLGSDDLYTLLNVLRPDLVIDHASFEQMAEPNRPINAAIQYCRTASTGWQSDARDCLNQVAKTGWGSLFLKESPTFQAVYDRLGDESIDDAGRISLTRTLEELYTFSPLINRTRRRDIGEFTTRKPETLTVPFTAAQQKLHDDLLDLVARILAFSHGQQNVKFMMTTLRRQAASCIYGLAPLLQNVLTGKLDALEFMEAADTDVELNSEFVDRVRADIETLLTQARKLEPRDPKVTEFLKVLDGKTRMDKNKSLVFSTFRHTLSYLEDHVKRSGYRFGLVHGDVPDEERADLRRRFALPKENPEAIDVLLSSEVGCEGLDFQFCDLLVNYDLPWNPMRIEQRIGRIDRYGQDSETVAIVNMVTPGTVDADIYQRCLWRIGVFQHSVGGNEEILGEITQELHDIADSFSLTDEQREQRLKQLADNNIRRIQEEQTLEANQAALFGLSVPNRVDELDTVESFWLSASSLQRIVSVYLSDVLQGSSDYLLGDKPIKTLRLNMQARAKLVDDYKRLPKLSDQVARQWEKWLKGSHPTLSVTFDQDAASETAEVVYLNLLHPLVRQAAESLEHPEAVYVSVAVSTDDVPVGVYPFSLYRWKKYGVRRDEALVVISTDPTIEERLMSWLPTAKSGISLSADQYAQCEALDLNHHQKWMVERANHIACNRELVEHRIQSLTVSHRARCKLLEERVSAATNEKIRLMKQSELARAINDYERRLEELRQAAESGDIRATPVIFGILSVQGVGT